MRSPLQHRLFPRIIVVKIIDRDLRVQPTFCIPYIFIPERIPVVFRVAHQVDFPASARHTEQHARDRRFRKDSQFVAAVDRLGRDFRISAVGDQEVIVKSLTIGSFLCSTIWE